MSLWSVPARWGSAFFILLVFQGGTLIGLQAWRTLVTEPDLHAVDTVMAIALVSAPLLVVAGIVSMIELEVALTLSAWFEWWVEKKRREEYEAGLVEGRDEGREEGIEIGHERGHKKGRAEGLKEGRRLERLKIERELGLRTRVRRYPF